MARDTDRRIKSNLMNPKFKKLLEESKLMVRQGKKENAAYHVLKDMNLEKDEDNPDLFCHIPDRQLAEILGMGSNSGKGTVFRARKRLKQERWGVEKVVDKVDTSQVKVIGKGSESVYLYYFPTYRLNSIYYIKYVDDSHETPIYACNIGRTIGDVKERICQQIGEQLPEKPILALHIKTDDCEALEKKVHEKLKRENLEDAVGTEWFLTNPAQVEGIVKSIDKEQRTERYKNLERAKQLLNKLGINDPSEAQLETTLEMLHSTKNSNE